MKTFGPAFAVVLLIAGGVVADEPSPSDTTRIPGFTAAGSTAERSLEARMADLLDPESTARHFRLLTAEPHPAGSPRNLELAAYVRDQFVASGLENVQMHSYDVLLPWPKKVAVSMVEPVAWTASLAEDPYPVDEDSYGVGASLTYLGMSASGDVTADVIYAHSGNPEDYDRLVAQGIDPRGKIAIVRYSNPYSYRGFKAWEAERRGVAALIIYSDPMDDGYRKGDVFPKGPWGPASHIQRGAITYDFIVPGDPLTPGWPSVEGAKRIPAEEARSVPKIPAVPMSWRDAQPILENLGGPVAPPDWQGALPITYHVGPGPAKVHVEVDMDGGTRSIQVIEGRIPGSEKPDELVILGNHFDAWVYGAVDPSSGTATLLEAARVLGKLAARGPPAEAHPGLRLLGRRRVAPHGLDGVGRAVRRRTRSRRRRLPQRRQLDQRLEPSGQRRRQPQPDDPRGRPRRRRPREWARSPGDVDEDGGERRRHRGR